MPRFRLVRRPRGWLPAAVVVWSAAVAGGSMALTEYANRAGDGGDGGDGRGVALPASESSRPYRLLMFAHPRCPCTAASVRQLSRLMSRCSSRTEARVYFFRPEDESDGWTDGRLWRGAAAIDGVTVVADPGGAAAARFGSRTSGNVLLFGTDGRLLFRGGITAGRGHEGDNVGQTSIEAIVHGEEDVAPSVSPVFGCALRRNECPAGELCGGPAVRAAGGAGDGGARGRAL